MSGAQRTWTITLRGRRQRSAGCGASAIWLLGVCVSAVARDILRRGNGGFQLRQPPAPGLGEQPILGVSVVDAGLGISAPTLGAFTESSAAVKGGSPWHDVRPLGAGRRQSEVITGPGCHKRPVPTVAVHDVTLPHPGRESHRATDHATAMPGVLRKTVDAEHLCGAPPIGGASDSARPDRPRSTNQPFAPTASAPDAYCGAEVKP